MLQILQGNLARKITGTYGGTFGENGESIKRSSIVSETFLLPSHIKTRIDSRHLKFVSCETVESTFEIGSSFSGYIMKNSNIPSVTSISILENPHQSLLTLLNSPRRGGVRKSRVAFRALFCHSEAPGTIPQLGKFGFKVGLEF